MTETLTEIAGLYKKEAPDVSLVYNFDSSGTLQTQIEEGAVCDLFLSAGQKQMDALETDFVLEGTRCDLLQNKVVLIAPKGAENAPASFEKSRECRTHRARRRRCTSRSVFRGNFPSPRLVGQHERGG